MLNEEGKLSALKHTYTSRKAFDPPDKAYFCWYSWRGDACAARHEWYAGVKDGALVEHDREPGRVVRHVNDCWDYYVERPWE